MSSNNNNNNNNAVPPAGNAGNAGGGGGGGGGGGRRGGGGGGGGGGRRGGGGGGGGGRRGGGGGGTGRGGKGGIASSRPAETSNALVRQDNKVSKKGTVVRQSVLPKPAALTILFKETEGMTGMTDEDMPEGMAVLARPPIPTLPADSNFGVWDDAVMTTGFKADLPSMMATITEMSRGVASDTPLSLLYVEGQNPHGRDRDVRVDFAGRLIKPVGAAVNRMAITAPARRAKDHTIKCGNCERVGHVLADCVRVTHTGNGRVLGDLYGCPVCNKVDHMAEDCPDFLALDFQARFNMLVVRRGGKPQIRTKECLYNNDPVFDAMEAGAYTGPLPLSYERAQELGIRDKNRARGYQYDYELVEPRVYGEDLKTSSWTVVKEWLAMGWMFVYLDWAHFDLMRNQVSLNQRRTVLDGQDRTEFVGRGFVRFIRPRDVQVEEVDEEENGAQQDAANAEAAEDNTATDGAGGGDSMDVAAGQGAAPQDGENLDKDGENLNEDDLDMEGETLPGTFTGPQPPPMPFFGTL
ncbi:hypothetical protein MCOR27_007838 [Pyricularia oryzae]|nr:hypothetical protein MCOR01_011716 [Pyricularia oryzae]KAI6259674.1 hypothetical protein MCOR19_004026 [Pyricularia oryzae]KAI6273468.1 hypothetical protein MCOR27_007838 [Pyricularia oryzae]KAI6280111.1 hypothetical protein MCOR26_003915 [Pyricularia oryzae]KAI6342145.1 hypothetical protein MCOR28_005542 [Pyricularia oryzae]